MSVNILKSMTGACQALQEMENAPPAPAEELRTLWGRYAERHEFKPGDLVAWKPGLKNCKWPAEGVPCIVMEVMPARRRAGNEGTDRELAPTDVRIGLKCCGDFDGYWVDGNRLEPYRAQDPAPEEAMSISDAEATVFAESAVV